MRLALFDRRANQQWPLAGNVTYIGTANYCGLRWDAAQWPMVQPCHALLQPVGDGLAHLTRISDQQKPDLWLNGQPVAVSAEVRLGDEIQFGAQGPLLVLQTATKTTAPQTASANIRAGMVACVSCGMLVSFTTVFCPACGVAVSRQETPPVTPASEHFSVTAATPPASQPDATPRYRGLIRPPLDKFPAALARGNMPPASPTPAAVSSGKLAQCSDCGANVPTSKAFCTRCGSPMDDQEQYSRPGEMTATVMAAPLAQTSAPQTTCALPSAPQEPERRKSAAPAPTLAQAPAPPPAPASRSGCLVSALMLPFNLMTGMVTGPGAAYPPALANPPDTVDCTVFAPPVVARQESFLVQVFAHLPDEATAAANLAREFDRQAGRRGCQSLAAEVARGARLDFHLVMPGLEVDLPACSIIWRGRLNSVQFGVFAPPTLNLGDVIGTVVVSLAGLPVGHIKFKVTIAAQVSDADAQPQATGNGHAYRRAFLSYAAEDWPEVSKRAQMLSSLKIGFDDAALRPETRGAHVNFRRIDESDLFLLFWSPAAQRSPLVLGEVEYALHRQHGDGAAPPEIMPVVLTGPPVPAPPKSLAQIEFSDYLPYFDSATAPTIVTQPATLDWSNPVGQRVGNRYVVEQLIGKGGFGTVYRARDEQLLARPVVVKLLRAEALRNTWSVHKFQHEIEALARLDHPGIVGIFDAGQLPDGVPYLVMQYVEGRNLRESLPAGGLALREAARVIRQVASALAEAHAQGILHRDLKPENIMLRRLSAGDTQAVVIDFGIAKVRHAALAPQTAEARIAGTSLYMSPEQLLGDELNAASDVYALGVVAYELLTGSRPFNPRTLAQLPEMQRRGSYDDPRTLRPELTAQTGSILRQALAYAPAQRFPGAYQLGAALAGSLETNV